MLTILLLTSLWLSLLTTLSSSQTLPPPSCIIPEGCRCTVPNDNSVPKKVSVFCENKNLTEVPDLSVVGYPVEHLVLRNNQIRRVRKTDFLNQTELHTIILSHNLIEEIEDGSFSSTILDSLYLDHNNLSSLPNDSLPTLTRLEIRYNNLTKIPSDFLYAATKLKSLDLIGNTITHLDAFSFFPNGSKYSPLEDLLLSRCNISHITTEAFANLKNLKSVELDYNDLKELNSSMLAGLPRSLQRFSATHCGIEVLTSDALINMERLESLSLAYNKIKRIEARSFKGMILLETLYLENNEIEFIHKKAFGHGVQLETIYLDNNKLESFHPITFERQTRLVEISLIGNQIATVQPKVFNVIPQLQSLDLGYNQIVEFPVFNLPKLSYFHIEANNFTYIGADAFVNVTKVQTLKLSHNQFEMHKDALKPLTSLKEFILTNNLMFDQLPDLSNNWNLKTLFIHHTNLSELPEDLCCKCPKLKILVLSSNRLTRLPKLKLCRSLIDVDIEDNKISQLDDDTFQRLYRLLTLNLNDNKISQLPDSLFADLQSVTTIYLQHNNIKEIPTNIFNNTHNLLELNMTANPVRVLQNEVFHNLEEVHILGLRHMGIEVIEPYAFPSNMTYLLTLDLSFNNFDYLPIPNGGWPNLRKLFLQDVFPLYSAPTPDDVPELEQGLFTYTYHCCAFEPHKRGVSKDDNSFGEASTTEPAIVEGKPVDLENFTPSPTVSDPNINICSTYDFLPPALCANKTNEESIGRPPVKHLNRTEIIFISKNARHIPAKEGRFICYPHSDPMTPCEDLLGSWVLRILIWVVFIVTLFGNGVVLTVILASPKPARGFGPHVRDRKIPQFFISQLAVADIGIGIYLGFLAVVDLKTFGKQEFYQLALSWQYGPGCLAAGFIAILSSELSVYILVVVTLERLYVHIYGMRYVKTHMCNAVIVILVGWAFAVTCATLPLIGFNSYTSVAICLPFDVTSTNGRFYIATLMGINLVAFFLLAGCNMYIFCSVHSRSSNTTASDAKLFRMVMILIFTDFACWAPLVAVSIGAVFKQDWINTSAAKWFAVLVLPINACANPFLYALLTEKFRQQVLNMYHNAKRAMLPCRQNGIQPQRRNSTAFEQLHRPSTASMELSTYAHTFGQNSPGSLSSGSISSSSVPFLGRRASLPAALGSDGLRVGSPRSQAIRFLPSIHPSADHDSMPDLTCGDSCEPYFPLSYSRVILDKPTKLSSQLPPVREQPCKLEKGIEINETSIPSNLLDERSSSDSPSLLIGSPVDNSPGDGDSASITSFSIVANSGEVEKDNDHRFIYKFSAKLNSQIAVEETDV